MGIGTRAPKFGIINQIYLRLGFIKRSAGKQIPSKKLSNSQGILPCRLFSISVKHNEASFSITKQANVLFFLISLDGEEV